MLAETLGLDVLRNHPLHVVFDEIHKYRRWKTFLKGFHDVYGDRFRAIVTGSARIDLYRRGGDSLMGRYFLYRMHPVTLAELVRSNSGETEIGTPRRPPSDSIAALLRFGGFPEPFLKQSVRFYNRWRRTRTELLFREDLRDLTRIQEAGQVQILAELLTHRTGSLLNYSNLAGDVNIAVDTAKRWVSTLESLYWCFTIRPWFRNVTKSLRKQPKVFLWDWSLVSDEGAQWENLIASHLLKAVHWWTDRGFGTYGMYYLRDTAKREADFLVTRNDEPWFIVEAKLSASWSISPAVRYFASTLGNIPAFQVVRDLPYTDADAFDVSIPTIVSAETFLSQLV